MGMAWEVAGKPTTFAVQVLAPPGRQKEPESSVRFQMIRRSYFLELQVFIFEQRAWDYVRSSHALRDRSIQDKLIQLPLKLDFHRRFIRNIHFPSVYPHSHTPNLLCCKAKCSNHTNSVSISGNASLWKFAPWPWVVVNRITKTRHQNVVKIALVIFLWWGKSNRNTVSFWEERNETSRVAKVSKFSMHM